MKLEIIVNQDPNFSATPKRGNLRLVISHGQVIEQQLSANLVTQETPKIHSLSDALESLGPQLYNQALHVWSLDELKNTMEACWGDTSDYEFIYNHRLKKAG